MGDFGGAGEEVGGSVEAGGSGEFLYVIDLFAFFEICSVDWTGGLG